MSLTNAYSILLDTYKETQFSISPCKDNFDDSEMIEEGISHYEIQDLDCISIYLRQIGKIPILRPDEEIQLFQIIRITSEASLETDEEQIYQARMRVLEGNLRLVVKLALRYRNLGLSFLDLIQEGNIGLIKAIDKFKPEKGYRFTTYATWWVQQSMMRALTDYGRTIRLPSHIVERLQKMNRSIEKLQQNQKNQPTIEDIARETSMPVDKVRHTFELCQSLTYLDSPINDREEKDSIIDLVENDNVASPEESFLEKSMKDEINKALSMLHPREAEILKLRFGLYDGKIHTLEQLGSIFGITRERVRQIEKKAISKLRHPKRGAKLKEFIE
ncbi:MAG: polymerase sigma factor [Candidatus Poribacteria bacterium]|nr:polymerase sigma factor [Candidatus Poribacteria bacterium]